MRSYHASEIRFVFGTPTIEADDKLSRRMGFYRIQFVALKILTKENCGSGRHTSENAGLSLAILLDEEVEPIIVRP